MALYLPKISEGEIYVGSLRSRTSPMMRSTCIGNSAPAAGSIGPKARFSAYFTGYGIAYTTLPRGSQIVSVCG